MNSWPSVFQSIVTLVLLRTAYEAGSILEGRHDTQKQKAISAAESHVNPKLKALFPAKRIAEIKKKELQRYELAQQKKWDRWMEKVSQ